MDFQMSLEDNIAYAKRNIVDLIYKVLVKRIIGALKDRMPNTDIEY